MLILKLFEDNDFSIINNNVLVNNICNIKNWIINFSKNNELKNIKLINYDNYIILIYLKRNNCLKNCFYFLLYNMDIWIRKNKWINNNL